MRGEYGTLAKIYWRLGKGILPMIRYIEIDYELAPYSDYSPNRELDICLFGDGCRMRDGTMRKIVIHDSQQIHSQSKSQHYFENFTSQRCTPSVKKQLGR